MKKQKSIKLVIPKPCSESWNNMSPNANGRHCNSCEKTVIDFSKLSDSEIFQVLTENSFKVCGKFSAYQLNRDIFQQSLNNRSIFPGVLFSAAIAACAINTANAQDKFAEVRTEAINLNNENLSDEKGPEFGKDSAKFIKGIVIDSQTGEPLPYTVIRIQENNKAVQTNLEGNFKIEIDSNLPDKFTLIGSYVGYNDTSLQISKNVIPSFLEITLSPPLHFIGEVIIVKKSKFPSNLFRRKRYNP